MEPIWQFCRIDRAEGEANGDFIDITGQAMVTLRAEETTAGELPARLYGRGTCGCHSLTLETILDSGVHELLVAFAEPEERVDVQVLVDGYLVGTNALYFDRSRSIGRVEHRYEFLCTCGGRHEIAIERPPWSEAGAAELLELALSRTARATNLPRWPGEAGGEAYLDIWGWQAPLSYSRSRPVDLDYYRRHVLDEPHKYGANLLHYWNWAGEDLVHDLLDEAHGRDMLYDEHWFPPRYPQDLPERFYRIAPTLSKLDLWSDHVANALQHGWRGSGDGWVPEEMAKGEEGASSDSANVIRTNHLLWRRNPGLYTSVFTIRPNSEPSGDCNTVDRYKGPNFVYAVSTQGGRGVDDRFSHRVFFGNAAFRTARNDLFFYLQAECRPTPHRGPFGGRSDPDWWLKQLCDFCRPRARDPNDRHETGVFWMLENDLAMPDELRDYVYAISLDPIRAAITTRLSSTGMGGAIWNVVRVARQRNALSCEYVGQTPRCQHPASTSFIQNNDLRLYRSALGDKGVLVWDPEQLAHYDSNSLSMALSDDFLRTTVAADDEPPMVLAAPEQIGLGGPDRVDLTFRAETGTYLLTVDQGAADGPSSIKVTVDGLEAGMYRTGCRGHLHRVPLYVHGRREHVVTLERLAGPGHAIAEVRIDATHLATRTVKSFGVWDDSPDELQHRVTRGVGGYEYGEWLYPACYLDLDDEPASEFPAGLGYGFPQPLNLDFAAEKGAYLLVVGAKARLEAGSLISVAVNPDAGMMKSPDYVPPEWFRYAGQYEVPGDGKWHRRVVPVNLYRSGKNRVQLAYCLNGREGHWFDAMEIVEAPVRHEYVEYGGHKAVLRELFRARIGPDVLRETRTYTMYADTPYFFIDIDRHISGEGREPLTYVDAHGYDTLAVDGQVYTWARQDLARPRTFTLRDSTGLRPDLNLALREPGSVRSADWRPRDALRLRSRNVVRESLRIAVAVTAPGEEAASVAAPDAPVKVERAVALPEDQSPLVVENPHAANVVQILRIADPGPGPYLVEEQGFWRVRGGQPARTMPGVDYLRAYLPAGGSVRVQRHGFIEGVVRPGYGCQHTVWIGEVRGQDGAGSCEVKVVNVTPALFAPRVRFAGEIGTARVDGQPWAYFDGGGLLLLPNRPGQYAVDVTLAETPTPVPHLTRTGASVARAVFVEPDCALELSFELPPWVRELPAGQRYFALIAFDRERYGLLGVEGAAVEDAGPLGEIISFRPGPVRVRFEKRQTPSE